MKKSTTELLREVLRKTLLDPCDHKRQSHADVGCVVADIEAAITSADRDAAIKDELLEALGEANHELRMLGFHVMSDRFDVIIAKAAAAPGG